jgi:tellurite resistance protein TerC
LQWREVTGNQVGVTTTLRTARRIVVAVVGGTITLLGVALLVLPGPAFIVIPVGLSILATEFVWARTWLHKVKEMASNAIGSRKT